MENVRIILPLQLHQQVIRVILFSANWQTTLPRYTCNRVIDGHSDRQNETRLTNLLLFAPSRITDTGR
jgi:hypothetical protein